MHLGTGCKTCYEYDAECVHYRLYDHPAYYYKEILQHHRSAQYRDRPQQRDIRDKVSAPDMKLPDPEYRR